MDKKFWIKVGRKLVENLLSVKVWVMFSYLAVSTTLLCYGLLTPLIWGSTNGGIISSVLAIREALKVAKIKSDDDTSDMMV